MIRVYRYKAWAPRDSDHAVRVREALRLAREYHAALARVESRRRDVLARLVTPSADDIARLNEAAGAARRWLRARCGVRHGTYLDIESAIDAAKRSQKTGRIRYRDYRDPFSLGEQFQVPVSAHSVLAGECNRLRIYVAQAGSQSRRAELRRKADVWWRIGSSGPGNKEPIWVRFDAIIHRPLPEGSVIRYARYRRAFIADREEWSLELTIEMPDVVSVPVSQRVVGIDIGWRKMGDELRVAVTDSGDELRLSEDLLDRLTYVDALRSIREREFNAVRARIGPSLRLSTTPEDLREKARTMALWKRHGRLVRLWRLWRLNRFVGDTEAFDVLEAWRHQDRHLWQWEAHQRCGSLAARKEVYRLWSQGIAARYGTVIVERFDLRRMATIPGRDAADHQRQLAAVGLLRSILKACVMSRGGKWIEVSSVNSTKECHVCGAICAWDQASKVEHACTCNARWDQDVNAARVLLARGRVVETPESAPRARAKGGAWAVRKHRSKRRDQAADATGVFA